jgi:hypothetical protein
MRKSELIRMLEFVEGDPEIVIAEGMFTDRACPLRLLEPRRVVWGDCGDRYHGSLHSVDQWPENAVYVVSLIPAKP